MEGPAAVQASKIACACSTCLTLRGVCVWGWVGWGGVGWEARTHTNHNACDRWRGTSTAGRRVVRCSAGVRAQPSTQAGDLRRRLVLEDLVEGLALAHPVVVRVDGHRRRDGGRGAVLPRGGGGVGVLSMARDGAGAHRAQSAESAEHRAQGGCRAQRGGGRAGAARTRLLRASARSTS